MKIFAQKLLLAVTLSTILFSSFPLSPAIAANGIARSMDEALLLMISSGYRLTFSTDELTSNSPSEGQGLLLSRWYEPIPKNQNEVEMLAKIYNELHAKYEAKADATLDGDQAQAVQTMLDQEHAQKIERLLRQAQKLKQQRSRRRRGGLFGAFRRIGQGIARAFAKTARALGRGTRFLVTQMGPAIAKEMVMKRLKAINAMLQGRIDLFWERVRGRLGPWAEVLKVFVDKAFVQERDKLTARLGLRAKEQWPVEGDWPEEAQVASDDEEGEGGYDTPLDCGDNSWIAPHMESIRKVLIEEGKICQYTAIAQYESCLWAQNNERKCEGEALAECESLLSKIPPNLPGDLTLSEANINSEHSWEREETFWMSVPAQGGQVTGQYVGNGTRKRFEGEDPCQYTVTIDFTGTFSTETCILSGTGNETLELAIEGNDGPCWAMGCNMSSEGCTRPGNWALLLKDDHFECTPTEDYILNICTLRISVPK